MHLGAGTEQRTVLGTLVDPLGLFRRSALIQNDERDRAARRAPARVASLASALLSSGGGSDGGSVLEGVDQQQLARALIAKAFERRDELLNVSRRVAAEALDQASERLTATAGK